MSGISIRAGTLLRVDRFQYPSDRYRDGRLWQVDDRLGNLYEYGYLPGSGEVASLARYRDGALRLRSEYAYDGAGRQRLIVHYAGDGSVLESFLYAYDALGRRERVDLAGGQRWLYGYDRRGQVASASKHSPDGASLAGHGRSYRYDDIGTQRGSAEMVNASALALKRSGRASLAGSPQGGQGSNRVEYASLGSRRRMDRALGVPWA